jgi:hypothetical protein
VTGDIRQHIEAGRDDAAAHIAAVTARVIPLIEMEVTSPRP